MPNTYVNYTANGSTASFGFSFPILSSADLKVYRGGVLQTVNTDFTISGSQVVFPSNLPNGTTVKIARETNSTARTVDFVNGARLTEADLDKDANQAFYLIQEIKDQSDLNAANIVAASIGAIVDGAVTAAKLASNSVQTAKISDGAITTSKIADGAVVTVDIADRAVTPAKLSTGAPSWSNQGALSVSGTGAIVASSDRTSVGSAALYRSDGINRLYSQNGLTGGSLVQAEPITWLDNGNVGMGTTAPDAQLHMQSSSLPEIRQRHTAATAGYYRRIYTDSSNQLIIANQSSVGVFLTAAGTSWTILSDERLKEDIVPITNACAKVDTLRTVTGRYTVDPEGTSRAFLIAQDVQAVLPEAVSAQTDEMGTLGLAYTDVIPLLTAAIKEQNATIKELTARVAALEAKA